MRKRIIIALLLGMTTMAFAEGKPQTTCPVMGGKVNPKQYVDVKGYRIYICCKGCIKPIQADPEKYIEKMKADGIELEKTPEVENK